MKITALKGYPLLTVSQKPIQILLPDNLGTAERIPKLISAVSIQVVKYVDVSSIFTDKKNQDI